MVIYCIVVCVLGCLYCLFSPRNQNTLPLSVICLAVYPVFGPQGRDTQTADAESYGHDLIANHQNNYDMVTASISCRLRRSP